MRTPSKPRFTRHLARIWFKLYLVEHGDMLKDRERLIRIVGLMRKAAFRFMVHLIWFIAVLKSQDRGVRDLFDKKQCMLYWASAPIESRE